MLGHHRPDSETLFMDHHRPASEKPLKWRLAGWLMTARLKVLFDIGEHYFSAIQKN